MQHIYVNVSVHALDKVDLCMAVLSLSHLPTQSSSVKTCADLQRKEAISAFRSDTMPHPALFFNGFLRSARAL